MYLHMLSGVYNAATGSTDTEYQDPQPVKDPRRKSRPTPQDDVVI
jgi:hypothetical protein